MVLASIASLKVAVTFAVGLIPVAPLAGEVDETVGGVVSGAIVNDQVTFAAERVPRYVLTRGLSRLP